MDNTQPSLQCKQYSKYQWVSTRGETWNTKRKDNGLSTLNSSGYKRLTTGELLHRVVFQLFVRELKGGEQINHINGDKLDNRLINLESCTARENCKHKARVIGSETNILQRKLSDIQVLEICNLLKDSKSSQTEIANTYKVTKQAIYRINTGKNYSRITEGRFRDYPIRSRV